jgi:nucleoside-diphosphate-sugar epimerase
MKAKKYPISKGVKKILIAGSEGNIGTYLVERIKKTRPDFKIIRVKLKQKKNERTKSGDLYIGDLTDPSFVNRIFKENKIDYVIHAAARLYGVAGFNEDVYGLYANDIQCLLNVLNHSRGVKKFIYFSSSMVYESSVKVPFTEELTDEIMPPKSSYGLTKYLGEKAVKFFNQQYGIKYTIWRPFNVVSPLESHERQGGHVFVDFYRKLFIERTPKIEIYGNGRQVRCFTWVEEITNTVADFISDQRTDNQIFNIGSNEPKNMIELKDILLQIGKEKGVLPSGYNPKTITGNKFFGVDVQLRVPSTKKIKKVLNWNCRTSFKECFEKFIEYKTKS